MEHIFISGCQEAFFCRNDAMCRLRRMAALQDVPTPAKYSLSGGASPEGSQP